MKKARRIGKVFPKPETPVFKCPYCDKAYKTEDGLNKHITEKHGDENNEQTTE